MPIALQPNEYLANLTNLCLQVVVFSNLSFKNPFNAFARQYTKWGDKIATVNAWVKDGENWNLGDVDFDNPFKAQPPTVYESTITTKLKKRYTLQLNEDLLRGAFEDDNSLGAFLTVLREQLETKSEIDIYEQIIADFATFKPENGLRQNSNVIIGDLATEENIIALYNKILTTARQFKLPNQEYGMTGNGTLPEMTATGDKPILFLRADVATAFDTYVRASLYNSSNIALDKYFKDVVIIDVDTNSNITAMDECMGWLCTDDVYRYSPRIKEVRQQPNGANLTINTFYHVWTNMGFTGAGQLCYIGSAA